MIREESPRHKLSRPVSAGQVKTLMNSVTEKDAVGKDGAVENARLMALIRALSETGFRVSRIETNGIEYDIKIRDTESD